MEAFRHPPGGCIFHVSAGACTLPLSGVDNLMGLTLAAMCEVP
jgi:hypothetical protein